MNEAPLGIEWPDTKERFARLKEAVTLIQTLWTNDRVTFDGAYLPNAQRHHLRPARRRRSPSTSLPPAPRPRALAGRVADGLICTSGKGMELYADTLLPAVTEGARAAGRDPRSSS